MKVLKNLGDGILKFVGATKEGVGFKLGDDIKDVAKTLKCSSQEDKSGDELKRQLAREQEERDNKLIELLKQIEFNTRG